MKRQVDVNELLAESRDLLDQIQTTYIEAETSEEIVRVARPKVKSCLEHLRSSLDYIAKDLSEHTKSEKTPRNVYFPYGKNQKIYHQALEKNLPDLNEDFRLIIESIQPHKIMNNWLLHLCKTTNFNKHTELQEQERHNSPESTTSIGNLIQLGSASSLTIGTMYVDGKHINPKGPLELKGDKPIAEIRDELDIEILIERKYEWVKFILKGTQIDILSLLTHAQSEIQIMSDRIYSV
ncbi:hypothetical protein [Vibrio alginolyticus]|uniref:hypothetical protein n=1 Tax=Vibrio alginolyticus TaxID=663 RepID=UPI0037552911